MKTSILFVCLGNICRSPTAEGVFRKKIEQLGLGKQFNIDSAGTSAYHAGEAPDPRSQQEAKRQGYDLSAQRSRQLQASDGEQFDYIIAMDSANHSDIKSIISNKYHGKLKLFLKDFAPSNGWECQPDCYHKASEVPDPYYGGTDGFSHVVQLIETASYELIKFLTVK